MSDSPSNQRPALGNQQLSRLLLLTRKMISSARQNEWEDVAVIDRQRLQVLDESTVAEGDLAQVPGSEPALTADLTSELMSADATLLSLAREQRDQLAEAGSQRHAQRTAQNHYAEAQRLFSR